MHSPCIPHSFESHVYSCVHLTLSLHINKLSHEFLIQYTHVSKVRRSGVQIYQKATFVIIVQNSENVRCPSETVAS